MFLKNFKRYSALFGVILLSTNSLSAQVDAGLDNLRTVVPPSPNVSSLGKFGEWPVSLYTGVPSISIPIYELKGRGISVPVDISYHASGIRVGDVASWVGLGWALNAGGCISRSIQGLPDEDTYFSDAHDFTDPNNLYSLALTQDDQYRVIGTAMQGTSDTQEDIYNMNVLGKSYRIFFKADSTAYTMPASNIKITGNFIKGAGASGFAPWTVVLEDGTLLVFGGNTATETSSNVRFGGAYSSAWYLQSITSPVGETVTFTYTSNTVTQDTHFTQSDYISYLTSNSPVAVPYFANSGTTSSHLEYQTVSQLSLSTIESDLTRVYFIPSPATRNDLSGAVSLSEIKVVSKLANTYVEDWLFNYVYSQATPGNEMPGNAPTDTLYHHNRLKLASINRKPTDNGAAQTWSFGYNPTRLPSRMSYAQDHWGFYNGATSNVSLLPNMPFNPTVSAPAQSVYTYSGLVNFGFMTPQHHDLGNIRAASENYMQAEMLDTVTYPTGGYTVFNYEGNGQPASQDQFGDTTVNMHMYLTYNQSPFTNYYSFPFTLTQPEYVNIYTSNISISNSVLNDYPAAMLYTSILDSSGNAVCGISGNGNGWYNLYVPGRYTFVFTTNCTQDLFSTSQDYANGYASFRFFPSHGVQNVKHLLGGVRLHSMQEFDGVSGTPVNSHYYQYDSAFVINPVDSVNDYLTAQAVVNTIGTQGATYFTQKLTRNTSTKYSFGSIQGGTVGYGRVTTYNGYNGAGGYTVSRFTCDPRTLFSLPASKIFPYPPSDPLEWRNGLLASEITYTAAGTPVKASRNYYSFYTKSQVEDITVGDSTINPPVCPNPYGGCGAKVDPYSITNERMQHDVSTQVAYNTATGDSLVSTTNYYYDDTLNLQAVRTVSTNSKGDTVLTYSRTALEQAAINSSIPLSTAATVAMDTLNARNIVGTPIESERYVKGVLAYKALTNYALFPGSLVLPNNVMVQNAANAIETRVQFNRYDTRGNLSEQQKTSDAKHSYVWDYSGNYPVAEVVNADSANIAYTSFEADGTGNWAVGSATRDATKGITGGTSYPVSGGAVSKSGLGTGRNYVVSYWTTNTSAYPSITGNKSGYPIQGKTITVNGTAWTYFEHKVTGVSSVSISGSGNIDELRLYPDTALMTTYTYTPLVGMTSQCDANNRITYYQYDGFNRLYIVRDQDRNVLKKYCYSYNGQSVACRQYYNAAKAGTYQKSCTAGYNGSMVTYTVAANTYASLASQAAADSLAQNDVNTNGQAYANANGTCTVATSFNITSPNTSGLSGFTATFTNTATSAQTVFNIPAAGGTLGNLPGGTYTVVLAKTGNTSTQYIYTVCTSTHAAAVTGTFSSVVVGSSCNTVDVDTVN